MNTTTKPAASKLHTCENIRTYGPKPISGHGRGAQITATVRYDDTCRNGHNSFGITGEIRIPGRRDIESGGMIHEEIAEAFPELSPFLKWHLMSSDAPMHYIENSLYWAGKTKWEKPSLENFQSTAIWPEATEATMLLSSEDLRAALAERLPALIADFRKAVESLGFVY